MNHQLFRAQVRTVKLSHWMPALLLVMLVLALVSHPVSAAEQEQGGSVRAAAVQVEAVITDIDHKNREITMQLPGGAFVTMAVGEAAKRLDEFAVGDAIVATYLTSLAGEVREPTAEEKANPWQEVDGAMVAGLEDTPGVAGMRVIKAVCTIEGMNRVAGTVMVKDPRGKYHLIGDVERERFEGRMLGDTIILVYTEAVALSLEKKEDMMAE
jgi:hypothetical protein